MPRARGDRERDIHIHTAIEVLYGNKKYDTLAHAATLGFAPLSSYDSSYCFSVPVLARFGALFAPR